MAIQLKPGVTPLPNELWEMILAYGDQQDFLVLSSVCKWLHQLSEPYLYREFSWVPDALPRVLVLSQKFRGSKPAPPPPFLLLRTITIRPELMDYIKHVKLLAVSDYYKVQWDITETNMKMKEHNIAFWEKMFALPNIKEHWKMALLDGRMDAIVALLLVLLRNIQSAELQVRSSTRNSIVFEALAHWYPVEGTCDRIMRPIKSVTITTNNDIERNWKRNPHQPWADWQNIYELSTQMTSLALLPQLDYLSLSKLHGGEDSSLHTFTLMDRATNLKKLTLRHSMITEGDLKKILEKTKYLEELDCDLQYDRYISPDQECSGHRIHEALSLVSETLTSLKLDIALNRSQSWATILNSLSTMKSFKKLRSMDIPFILVVPTTGPISETTIAEFLPEQLDLLNLRPRPMIPYINRGADFFGALKNHLARNPHVQGQQHFLPRSRRGA